MEYPSFLSVDDLVEQDRDEIQRILFSQNPGRKMVVEFSLTLEYLQKLRKNELAGNPYVGVGYVMSSAAGQPFVINPAVRPTFHAMAPLLIRPNGSGNYAITGNPVIGAQGGYPMYFSPGFQHMPPGFIWLRMPSALPVQTPAVANIPPYHPTVSPSDQAALLQHLAMQPNDTVQEMNCQPCMNGDEENGPSSISSKFQVPDAVDGDRQSISVPPATPVDAEISRKEEIDLPPADNTPSDTVLPNAETDGADGISADNIGQTSDQEMDPGIPCDGPNSSVQETTKQDMTENSTSIAQPTAENSQTAPKIEEPKPVKEEPKCWASLFRHMPTAKQAIITTLSDEKYYDALDEDAALQVAIHESARESAGVKKNSESDAQLSLNEILLPVERDPLARSIADALKKHIYVDRGPTYAIRGIHNRGNWCYINATLQALIACPTFFHFLRQLNKEIKHRLPSSTPLLVACMRLASEFTLVKDLGKGNLKGQSATMPALDLSFMHNIISQLKTDCSFKGRQEDAEEFLLFVLNQLHEEMIAVLSLSDKSGRPRTTSGNDGGEASGNNEWQQVGAGKKITVTRQITVAQSPILHIFAGQLRYGLTRPGAKESANLEPFFTLPLDILLSNVHNIHTALRALTRPEVVKNCQGQDKTEGDATRHVTFYELPRVLILQLKYFEFTEQGVKKNIKPIDYAQDLTIGPEFLSAPSKVPMNERHYKLFAVVFHHGEKAEGGHYTVDIFHAGHWMNIDDTKTTPVKENHVLSFQPPRVPYLLFYRRFEPEQSHLRRSKPDITKGVKG